MPLPLAERLIRNDIHQSTHTSAKRHAKKMPPSISKPPIKALFPSSNAIKKSNVASLARTPGVAWRPILNLPSRFILPNTVSVGNGLHRRNGLRVMPLPDISNNADSVKLFLSALLHSLLRVVLFVLFSLCIDDRGSFAICRADSVRPKHLSDQTSTMITSSNSLGRERDAQSFGRRSTSRHVRFRAFPRSNRIQPTAHIANHCATSSTTERRVSWPWPLWQFFSPGAHRQVHIAAPPVWVTPCGRLRRFPQQVAQQCVALLADVSQPLLAGAGVLTGNQPCVAADLLAARKPLRSPDDQNVDQPGDGSHARVGHQPYRCGPLLGFLLDGGT